MKREPKTIEDRERDGEETKKEQAKREKLLELRSHLKAGAAICPVCYSRNHNQTLRRMEDRP